ncbi:MAG TPA: class E sortase [Propionibacteriaceae bacterium]|jgi:sortase A|nr:class E sortase [Micropruina sp.]HBY22989.1 class E sortase [Propionibacteriaceae bacterium]
MLGEILLTVGVLIVVFAIWLLLWTDVTAGASQRQEVTSLRTQLAHTTKAPDVQLGDAYAIVQIPRFGTSFAMPVYQGTDSGVLTKGLGHYPETAQPGQVGNASFAGHRTTYGRPLWDIDLLRDGDSIIVTTAGGYYVYKVIGHEIVSPDDVGVIAPVPGSPETPATESLLTLTSCDPKFTAQRRYIVHARLAETFTPQQGLPAAALVPPTGG